MKVYHNPSYTEYDGGDCYLIYLMDGIMFLNTPKDTFKVIQKPNIDPSLKPDDYQYIKEEDLDTYAACRGFEKAVDVNRLAYSMESPEIIWYNDYDKDPKKSALKARLTEVLKVLTTKNKYQYPNTGYFPTTYQILVCFLRMI